MTEVQPMKMAAAEALYDTKTGASFSIFTIGTPRRQRGGLHASASPRLLSFIATGNFDGKVEGINDLQAAYDSQVRPRRLHARTSPVTYWTFRFMIGIGMFGALIAVWALWRTRKGKGLPRADGLAGRRSPLPLMPLLGNSFGWIFTEMGRQPWIVFGLMPTAAGVSPGVSAAEVLISPDRLHARLRRSRGRRGAAAAEVHQAPACPSCRGRVGRPTTSPPTTVRRRASARWRSRTERPRIMELTTVWFILIAVLWIGYFVLEGFDFGVGILLPVLGRDDRERRVLINTIGPVWDGNEVWLLVAGGATFAAFPEWYATLFSGFYLPLFLILVSLIVRNVAFEYRGKRDDACVARMVGPGDLLRLAAAGGAVGRRVRQHRARRGDRRRQGVRRHVLRPAQPVRAARRPGHADRCSSPTAPCSCR